jgi:threonine dehydrogenase-like Zn-dependent dehydrogenase
VPWADAMLVGLPAGVDPVAVASMSDNIPDGWRTVAPYVAEPESASVLIVGNGGGPSIPFYSIAVARALGVAQLDYVDRDPQRLAKAERLGANPIEGPAGKRAGSYSITVAASTDPAALVYALRSTAPGGTCTSNGFVGEEVALPLLEMYTRGVTLVTGRVDARAVIPHALELVVEGRLHPEAVTDAVVDWDDAPQALVERPVKMVFRRTP